MHGKILSVRFDSDGSHYEKGPGLKVRPCLSLTLHFHRLSLTSHCLSTAFPWHFTAFSAPFLDFPLYLHCL